MNDVLTASPSDTGEHRIVDPGQTTRNLTPYASLPPAFRRPAAFTPQAPTEPPPLPPIPAPEDTLPVPQPNDPRPVPNPVPTPGIYAADAQPVGYVGRHRAADDLPADVPPGRFGWLKSVLTAGLAKVRGAM
jgi:hypothetical protein